MQINVWNSKQFLSHSCNRTAVNIKATKHDNQYYFLIHWYISHKWTNYDLFIYYTKNIYDNIPSENTICIRIGKKFER